jgi:hypothetical protein
MYTQPMRRILAISLLLLFALPAIAPLFALSGNSDANLPACCRRNGKHHCAMSMEMAQAMLAGTQVRALPMKCPLYPKALTTAQHHELSSHSASLIAAGLIAHPALHLQTEARARVSRDCARQKRGPPALLT